MKKIEIKRLGVKSVFKVTLYIMAIPLGLLMLVGLAITLIAVALQRYELLVIGIPYMIMPIFMLGLYGLFGMLNALIYNLGSKYMGGLEVEIEEKPEIPAPQYWAAGIPPVEQPAGPEVHTPPTVG